MMYHHLRSFCVRTTKNTNILLSSQALQQRGQKKHRKIVFFPFLVPVFDKKERIVVMLENNIRKPAVLAIKAKAPVCMGKVKE